MLEGYNDADKTRMAEAVSDAIRLVIPAPPEAVTVMIHERKQAEYMRGRQHRAPAAALPDPTQTVHAYLTAMEARDLTAARGFLAEGFTMTFPGTGPMTSLDQLIAWSKPRYRFVTKSYEGIEAMQSPGDEAIVYCRGTLSGEWPDGRAFTGIRFIDRFELVAGKITRQDVWNDIAETRAAP